MLDNVGLCGRPDCMGRPCCTGWMGRPGCSGLGKSKLVASFERGVVDCGGGGVGDDRSVLPLRIALLPLD